jgi:hypothetical protein
MSGAVFDGLTEPGDDVIVDLEHGTDSPVHSESVGGPGKRVLGLHHEGGGFG